jgi:hypothetical protein
MSRPLFRASESRQAITKKREIKAMSKLQMIAAALGLIVALPAAAQMIDAPTDS